MKIWAPHIRFPVLDFQFLIFSGRLVSGRLIQWPFDYVIKFTVRYTEQSIVRRELKMKKYVCSVCAYVYDPVAGDPDSGLTAGTMFDEIADSWVCPVCGVTKDMFEPE